MKAFSLLSTQSLFKTFTAKHEPCYVSLCSNSAEGLVWHKVKHLLTISRAAYEILKPKNQIVLDALDERGDRRSTNLKNKVDDFLKERIVLGFNSGKYNINVVKVYLLKSLHPGIMFTIKKYDDDMCIKTKELKFLDMKNYLAAGTSYDQFLKAYGVQVSAWKGQKMTTLRDFWFTITIWTLFLSYKLLKKRFLFFKTKPDMFKFAISVPGLTLNYLFSLLPPNVYFTLISKQNRDLHSLFKKNLVGGGPSIVFHRHHEKDLTSLHAADFPKLKICKSIIGFDTNASYLYAIMQDMPTRQFVRYQMEDDFKP